MAKTYSTVEKSINEVFQKAQKIFFFVGSGVSVASGIAAFRGVGEMEYFQGYPPMYLCSEEMWVRNPGLAWSFFKHSYNLISKTVPNKAHSAIANLQGSAMEKGKTFNVLTLAYDGLLDKAGVKDVVELHGTINKVGCTKCNKIDDMQNVVNQEGIPKCSCKGVLRPAIALLNELIIDEGIWDQSIAMVERADLFVSIGTSGVQQHSGIFLSTVPKGKIKIEINPNPSYLSRFCDYNIRGTAEEILPQIII